MADETITIHAARRHPDGSLFLQFNEPEGVWFAVSVTALATGQLAKAAPVRIVTPDLSDREASLLAQNSSLRDELDRGGLSAEQEIRARAAELWIAADYTSWKLGDWCAWIRDGRTPDEAGLSELGHHEGYRG